MWGVMMVTMMLPPLLPVLARLRRNRLAALAGAGYFSVWTLFGAIIYGFGSVVARTELQWPALARLLPPRAAAVVLPAGAPPGGPLKGPPLPPGPAWLPPGGRR